MNIRKSFENITSSTAAHTAATRIQVLKGFPQAPGNKQPSNEQEGLDLLTCKFTNLIISSAASHFNQKYKKTLYDNSTVVH